MMSHRQKGGNTGNSVNWCQIALGFDVFWHIGCPEGKLINKFKVDRSTGNMLQHTISSSFRNRCWRGLMFWHQRDIIPCYTMSYQWWVVAPKVCTIVINLWLQTLNQNTLFRTVDFSASPFLRSWVTQVGSAGIVVTGLCCCIHILVRFIR